ncbi:MAG: annexin [Bacteroidota bacterium]
MHHKVKVRTPQSAQSRAAAARQSPVKAGQAMRPPALQLRASSQAIQRTGGDPGKELIKALGAATRAVKLRDAMSGLGTDEQAIFDILRPLTRSQVKQTKKAYLSMYGKSLIRDLRDELTDGELTKALKDMFYWPYEHGVLGSHQLGIARQKLLKLAGYELDTFSTLVDLMRSSSKRAYLYKALAAGNSVFAIIVFAYRIKDKSPTWINNHLRLTNNAGGAGIKQQWQMSCGPTTTQAVQGELDPIYALDMHDKNPQLSQVDNSDGTKTNPDMAGDQKSMLESSYSGSAHGTHAGKAAPRNNTNKALIKGRWVDDLLNKKGTTTGVKYTHHGYAASLTTFTDAVSEIDSGLEIGLPVPIVIGSAAAPNAHYVLVTRKSGDTYTIHDPGAGKAFQEKRDALLNGTLSKFGSYNRIWAVETPSAR